MQLITKIPTPSLASTLVADPYNQEWRPASFTDLLQELLHIQESVKEAFIFRGHCKVEWLLHSTFSRRLKELLKLSVSHRYPKQSWNHTELQHSLARIWLEKQDSLVISPQLFEMAKERGICPYFQFYQHCQHNPDDPNFRDIEPRGTNFVDFSFDWKVALFFANYERQDDDEGALFVVRQSALGPGTFLRQWQGTMDGLRARLRTDPPIAFPRVPSLVFPPNQANNTLDPKPKRQKAVYLAQLDFRFDFGLAWDVEQEVTGTQVFVKLILPRNTKQEVQEYLESHGITREYLLPTTVFSKVKA